MKKPPKGGFLLLARVGLFYFGVLKGDEVAKAAKEKSKIEMILLFL